MVIEDDPDTLATVVAVLQHVKYNVLTAPNGKSVIKILEEGGIDLVLTDIVMPEVDGLEVILAMRPKFIHIPVVAMSAWSDPRAER